MYKYLFFAFLISLSLNLSAQNKKILFNFNEIPQTLMVNPGAEVNFQWHFGVPALSNIYTHIGISGFSVNDLFANDGINFNTKLENLVTRLDNKDFYTANQQTEIFDIGFRLNNQKNDYLSFGLYQEFDGILYHPKDFITLAYNGNADFNKKIDFSDLSFKAELLSVYHIGINRKINDKLTLGTRLKIYSSVFNVSSINNSGYLFTTNGENNIYHHQMQNADVIIRTSGIVYNKESVIDQKIVNRFLASGNMGLGLDFGLTYQINKKWKTTFSFTDFGFIKHTKSTTVYKVQGTRDFDGFNLEFPTDNPIDYLSNFSKDFPTSEKSENFTTLRSLKLNGALIYNFGQVDNNSCLRKAYKNKRRNELGIELYSILRPKKPQAAVTLFYYKRLAKFFRAKFTYSTDSYSAKNIGVGFSSHIGKLNLYGSFDNLIGFADLSKSNNQTINFGINFIMDKDNNKP